jgi:hypothetical protein
METLARDRDLRARMAGAARTRALAFDWRRYHRAIVAVVNDLIGQENDLALTRPDGRHARGFVPARAISRS